MTLSVATRDDVTQRPLNAFDGQEQGSYISFSEGTDTIRAFCTTDIDGAQSLRQAGSQIARGRQNASVGRSLITGRGLAGISQKPVAEKPPKQVAENQSVWGAATITVDIANE